MSEFKHIFKTKAATYILYGGLTVVFGSVTAFGIAQLSSNKQSDTVAESKVQKKEKTRKTSETTSDMTTETTTVLSQNSGKKKMVLPDIYFNTDGKLYGSKGIFSGLWPTLEGLVAQSNESYIKALAVYVGDNTELDRCAYENDKFIKINGYGTVHWSQWGHAWPDNYSCAGGAMPDYEAETYSPSAAPTHSEQVKEDSSQQIQSDTSDKTADKKTEEKDNENIQTNKNEGRYNAPKSEFPDFFSNLFSAEKAQQSQQDSSSEPEVKQDDASLADESEGEEQVDDFMYSEQAVSAPIVLDWGIGGIGSITSSSATYGSGSWGASACGVCSLAMALSTLSGVTVSPPECALAANLLIGNGAWYGNVLYSTSQARLAAMAGFPTGLEPWQSAKKETLDNCLDNNGVALFVTDKQAWASGGGKHYIMVRGRQGDKYYTADSGKNPTGAFTYDEISSGYCEQYIVYIYPKNYKGKEKR